MMVGGVLIEKIDEKWRWSGLERVKVKAADLSEVPKAPKIFHARVFCYSCMRTCSLVEGGGKS